MLLGSEMLGTKEAAISSRCSCFLLCSQLLQPFGFSSLLQDAACWLRKARLLEQPWKERAALLGEMARAVQLLSARVSLSDSPDGQKPAQQLPLVAPWASRDPEDDEKRPVDASSHVSGLDGRCVHTITSCRVKCTKGSSALLVQV